LVEKASPQEALDEGGTRSAAGWRVILVVRGRCWWKASDSSHLALFVELGWTRDLDRVSNELAMFPHPKWRDTVTTDAQARCRSGLCDFLETCFLRVTPRSEQTWPNDDERYFARSISHRFVTRSFTNEDV
jgi:hypothetical protein